MSATIEPVNLRRRNYHNILDRMVTQFREWRENNYDYRMEVPYTTTMTPKMGLMDDAQRDHWARRICTADAEASINRTNEAAGRAKSRSSEAQ